MPLPKKNLKKLEWKRKIRFQVERDHFVQFYNMTSLSDIVKTFDRMDALELWKDPDGNYHWATCITLSEEEIKDDKRVVLTYNQVMLIPGVKAEFSEWKKKKSDEPPKKLCGFRTPLCVTESLSKTKKPRAPAAPKKNKEEEEAKDVAKDVAKGKKKRAPVASSPAAILSKHTAAALAGMDIDSVGLGEEVDKKLTVQPFDAPGCLDLDVTKEFAPHLQVLHLMSIIEDQDNQEENLVERVNNFLLNYRGSEIGTTKKTLVKWSKESDFANLLAGFGLSVLAVYKNKVINPFVVTANDKLKEVVALYEELQAKIKSSRVFANQLKADKERLADDLQSLLAKNRALETELQEKKSEVLSLYKQLEERKKQDDNDEKKKHEEEISAIINDPTQTVISSSGGFRKRDELSPAPPKKKIANVSATAAALADSDDEMELDSGKLPAKPAQKPKVSIPVDSDDDDVFAKPAAPKKRNFAESDDEESKPAPKKAAAPAPAPKNKDKPVVSLADSDDEDDAFAKPAKSSKSSATAIAKIGRSLNFDDSDDDDDQASKPVAKPVGVSVKAKPNAIKHLLDDDE